MIIRPQDEGTVADGMLTGVMSDTHNDTIRTGKAVSRFNREGTEHVLHAGDLVLSCPTRCGYSRHLTGRSTVALADTVRRTARIVDI
jgi:predicted phosphodiesterase